MYISIGSGRYVRKKNILGIFDLDNATVSSVTRLLLTKKEKEGSLVSVKEDIPKSIVIVSSPKREQKKKEKSFFYLSKFSSGVLAARASSENEDLIEGE
ncbi:MAG: hypothetical protein J6K61_00835 [Clostridia bacterium]|nr:hypothetical protein [Clostridia bacterium]